MIGLTRIICRLLHGAGNFLDAGGGLFERCGLLLGAGIERIVALGNFTRTDPHLCSGAMHIANHFRQLRDGVIARLFDGIKLAAIGVGHVIRQVT